MEKLKINYKYIVGQVVYFMYENEVRKGIVTTIEISANTKRLATYLTKQIIDKIISIFSKDYPFRNIRIRYSLDLVSKEGDFESSPHYHYEENIFKTKEELLLILDK